MASIKSSLILKDRFSSVLNNVNKALGSTVSAAAKMGRGVNSGVTQAASGFNDISNKSGVAAQAVSRNVHNISGAVRRLNREGFSSSNSQVKGLATQLRGVSSATEEVSRRVHIINGSVATLNRGGLSQTARHVSNINTALGNTNRQTSNTGKSFDRIKEKVGKVATGIMNAGANLGGWIYSLQTIGGQFTNIMGKLDEITAQTARSNILGDMMNTSGAEIQKMVKAAASTVGAEYGSFLDNISKMGIMTDGLFAEPKELIAFNTQLQKMYKIAGAGQAQMDSATLQLTQALAGGTLRGEEFNAIFEAAPNIIQTVAQYMGVTTGEMKNLASEGVISAEIVKNALLSAGEEVNKTYATMPNSFRDILNQIASDVNTYLAPVAAAFAQLWTYMMANWESVGPILMWAAGIVLALGTAFAVAAGGVWLYNIAMMANPTTWVVMGILLLIGAILALVGYLIYLYNTNLEVKYGILGAWTEILNFFDSVPPFFYNVATGIINAFSYAADATLQVMQGMANGVISIINGLINMLNNLPGVFIEPIAEITGATDKMLKNEAKRQERRNNAAEVEAHYQNKINTRNDTLAKNRAADEANAKIAAERKNRESSKGGSAGFLNDALKGVPTFKDMGGMESALANAKKPPKAPKKPKATKAAGGKPKGVGKTKVAGGKLDSVKKIEDDLTFSEENIKLLKDIATTKITHNYTKLRPNLKVQFGDVRETADAKKLLEAVEEMIMEAYDSSLQSEVK